MNGSILIPLLPPVVGLGNGTLVLVLRLERGRVLDCTFCCHTSSTAFKTNCPRNNAFTFAGALTLFLLRGEGDTSVSDSVSL